MSILDWVTTTDSECSADNGEKICVSKDIIKSISKIEDAETALNSIKKKTECQTEYCALAKLADSDKYAPIRATLLKEMNAKFKPVGPRNSTKLTSNSNLDETLQMWAKKFPSFFPFDFCMIDFQKTRTCLLGRIQIDDVFKKYTHAGCILNTDVETGKGKHWVCIFMDDRKIPRTIEYFNSSGNPPPKHILNWMTQTAKSMKKQTKVVVVSNRRLQNSKTECGLYCLFFIRARCEGLPYEKFREYNIPDKDMIEFRKHVFTST